MPADDLAPDRGVAALVDGDQVAVFLLSDGSLHALDNHDPCLRGQRAEPRAWSAIGAAWPWSRHRSTSRGSSCATGRCLDEPWLPVQAHHVARVPTVGCSSASASRPAPPRDRHGAPAPDPPPPAGRPDRRRRPWWPGPSCCPSTRASSTGSASRMEACIGCHSCEVACAEQNGSRRHGVAPGRRDRGRARSPTPSASTCRWRATTASSPRASRAAPPNAYVKLDNGVVAAPRRRLHRLPVLHLELPLLGARVPARPADRHQVRHVPPPARGRAGPGLRRRLPDRRHHGREGQRRGVAGRPLGRQRSRTCPTPASPCPPPASTLPADLPAEMHSGDDWSPPARAPALAAGVAHAADPGRRRARARPPPPR